MIHSSKQLKSEKKLHQKLPKLRQADQSPVNYNSEQFCHRDSKERNHLPHLCDNNQEIVLVIWRNFLRYEETFRKIAPPLEMLSQFIQTIQFVINEELRTQQMDSNQEEIISQHFYKLEQLVVRVRLQENQIKQLDKELKELGQRYEILEARSGLGPKLDDELQLNFRSFIETKVTQTTQHETFSQKIIPSVGITGRNIRCIETPTNFRGSLKQNGYSPKSKGLELNITTIL